MNDKEKNNKNWFSRQSKVVKSILGIVGICCIVLIMIFALRSMLPDSLVSGSFSESKLYENEYISFKYPKSLTDITIFGDPDRKNYIFYSLLEDSEPERNGMFVYSEEIDISSASTYLDEFYEYLNTSKRSWVKNFTLEKTNLHGIPAIKVTEEYDEENGSVKYATFLHFIDNGKFYTFCFCSDILENTEYMYELAKSSIILK